MPVHDYLQFAIAALIVLAVFWSVHRHGRGNPESTGKLARQIGKLFAEVRRIDERLGDTATKAEVALLSGEMKSLEQNAASSGEVIALEGKINALHVEVAAIAKAADRTEDGVKRIEGLLLKKAMES